MTISRRQHGVGTFLVFGSASKDKVAKTGRCRTIDKVHPQRRPRIYSRDWSKWLGTY